MILSIPSHRIRVSSTDPCGASPLFLFKLLNRWIHEITKTERWIWEDSITARVCISIYIFQSRRTRWDRFPRMSSLNISGVSTMDELLYKYRMAACQCTKCTYFLTQFETCRNCTIWKSCLVESFSSQDWSSRGKVDLDQIIYLDFCRLSRNNVRSKLNSFD